MAAIPTEENPYVGPRPFGPQDTARFFGRELEARALASLIVAHHILILYSQSGAGKTSLVNTRLSELLVQDKGAEVLPLARVRGQLPVDIEPEVIPNRYIFNAITNDALLAWGELQYPQMLTKTTLSEYLCRRPHKLDARGRPSLRVLFFDQFEEIFGLHEERWRDRKDFFEQVVQALEDDPLLRIIFVIRDDYIAQLDPYTPLLSQRLQTRFRLERLRRETALEAIISPLSSTKRSFAPGEAEKLVENLLEIQVEDERGRTVKVIGEFVEPVQLEIVCYMLWERLPPDIIQITEEHINTYADVDQALAAFYEQAIGAVSRQTGVHQHVLRQWCESYLITSSGTRNLIHREPDKNAKTQGIPNKALDMLEEYHLIHSTWYVGARWLELTHDRFIRPIRISNATWMKYYEEQIQGVEHLLRNARQYLTGNQVSPSDYKESLKLCKQARQISEQTGYWLGMVKALSDIGDIYTQLQDYSEALSTYSEALSNEPEIGDEGGIFGLYMAIGDIYQYTKQYDKAEQAYLQARESVEKINYLEGIAATLMALGFIYQKQQYDEKALKVYLQAFDLYQEVRNDQGVGQALTSIGIVYEGQGQPVDALQNYVQAYELFYRIDNMRSAADALALIAELYQKSSDFEQAVNVYSEYIKLRPSDPHGYDGRAAAYWYWGKYPEAVADYTEELKLDASNFNAYNGRGQVFAEMGNYAEALKDLNVAVRMKDSDEVGRAYARNGRGLAYAGLRDFKRALNEFQASIEAQPDNAWVYYNRAQAYEWMGRPEDAKADYQRALESRNPPLNLNKREHAVARLQIL